MPLTHVQTFRVRHCECDAYGYVKYTNYLNYMQEAAFDASAAAGYDLARYEEIGHHWLVRETDVEYLYPLRYGDSVQVKTWVADFRRVRSRRDYELRLVDSGDLIARATTDWVFLNSANGQPASVPPELTAAFYPEGVPERALPRSRFPAAPVAPPDVFRMQRRVEWRDIDTAQHVNNAVYVAYLEDCEVQVAAAYGWPRTRMREERFAITARRHRIEYRQPGVLGDELELTTWISDVARTDSRSPTAVRHYAITRASDHALLARVRVLWGAMDVDTKQPIPIPDAFLADLAPNIVDEQS